MYTKDKLLKYEYFVNLLKKYNVDYILDPLTGLITRKYILKFVDDLINRKIPFAMAIFDLDNFKNINDNYGHGVGDIVLERCAKTLIDYIGEDGIAGRYGGDEFLIIYFKDNSYQGVYDFLFNMYNGPSQVLQRTFCIGDVDPFVTATIGATSYPLDATDYDSLFLNADKALYRGKRKGRNCFIVYVEAKHKDITISNTVREPLYIIFDTIYGIINDNRQDKFERICDEINNYIGNSDIIYIDKDLNARYLGKKYLIKSRFDQILDSTGLFSTLDSSTIENEALKNFAEDLDIESLLISRIGTSGRRNGYLLVECKNIQRLWQDEEKALISFSAKILEGKGIL